MPSAPDRLNRALGIARGVPRLTRDIDVAVAAASVNVSQLLDRLEKARIVARIPDAEQFARTNQVLLLMHAPTAVEIDLSLAWLPFEQEALEHAESLRFGRVSLPVARVEDLLIYKAIAWRERDKDDIERLFDAHRAHLDMSRVRARIQEFCEMIEEPERLAQFDSLLERP